MSIRGPSGPTNRALGRWETGQRGTCDARSPLALKLRGRIPRIGLCADQPAADPRRLRVRKAARQTRATKRAYA